MPEKKKRKKKVEIRSPFIIDPEIISRELPTNKEKKMADIEIKKSEEINLEGIFAKEPSELNEAEKRFVENAKKGAEKIREAEMANIDKEVEYETIKVAGDQDVPDSLNSFKVKKGNPLATKDKMITMDEAVKKLEDTIQSCGFNPDDIYILSNWLRKKYRKYFYREGETEFFGKLACRLLGIVKNKPDHEIAKILKGE